MTIIADLQLLAGPALTQPAASYASVWVYDSPSTSLSSHFLYPVPTTTWTFKNISNSVSSPNPDLESWTLNWQH